LDSGEYVTFNQLIKALGFKGYTYKIKSWIKNRKFPVKYKKVNGCSFRVVSLDDFWKWAKKNKSFLDFSKLEENALGKEPKWLKQQRKIAELQNIKYRTTPWSKEEDERLKVALKRYKYTWRELSQMFKRTEGAIQRRVLDLGIKERPLPTNNHIKWTDEEHKLLHDMLKKGYTYELMAEQINRSVTAIRGKVYNIYGTKNLDNARRVIKREESRVG